MRINRLNNNHFEDNKYLFDLCVRVRELEIKLFWQRSLYFIAFIVATFSGIGIFYNSCERNYLILWGISFFGYICSLIWFFASKGSKFWQENWEQKVAKDFKQKYSSIFTDIQPLMNKGILGAGRFSVSRLATLLSLVVTLVFLCLQTIFVYNLQETKITKILLLLFCSLIPIIIIILTCTSDIKGHIKDER